jgi:hypothetical protein
MTIIASAIPMMSGNMAARMPWDLILNELKVFFQSLILSMIDFMKHPLPASIRHNLQAHR